jgi:DnaK suppressor protein
MATDDLDVEFFTAELHRLRQELLLAETTGAESAATVELDQSRLGRLSRMDAMGQQAMSKAANQRRKIQLQKVTAALQRIENGGYGICSSCDEQIDPRRLKVDPAAVVCIGCAEALSNS